MKPTIFIASSSEQLPVARAIEESLKEQELWNVNVWTESFAFSAAFIESLEEQLDRADFAIVVLTGHDRADVRGSTVVLPRDNVLFELGLFIGRLGRSRCFFVVDAESGTAMASDLMGVKAVTFYPEAIAGPGTPGLSSQVAALSAQMRRFIDRGEGLRYGPDRQAHGQQEKLWRFSSRLAGHWWERIAEDKDEGAWLSYLTIKVNPGTNTPVLGGRSFSRSGAFRGDWWSVTTGVELEGLKPTVFYQWAGTHRNAEGQNIGGPGVFFFDDKDRPKIGDGYYFGTNFAEIAKGAPTRVKHVWLYPCTEGDIAIMDEQSPARGEELARDRLASLRGG
jgi:hypothetical protein